MAKDAVLFVLVLLAARASNAYEPNYCPFPPHEQPPGNMIPCKSVYSNHSGGQTLQVFVADPIVITIQRADPNGGSTASLIEKGDPPQQRGSVLEPNRPDFNEMSENPEDCSVLERSAHYWANKVIVL